MILVSQGTIFAGIYSYTTNHKIETNVHYMAVGFFILMFTVMELTHQRFLAQEPIKFNKPVNTIMTEQDLELEVTKGKQKLVILDDLVLDVTQFAG